MDECETVTVVAAPPQERPAGDVDDLIFPAGPDWYASER